MIKIIGIFATFVIFSIVIAITMAKFFLGMVGGL